jgi:23S rRNA (adenine2503-C2)-methyltransferase
MKFLLETPPQQLRDWLAERGQADYRLGQIRHWVMQRRARDFAAMSELPSALRQQLAEEFSVLATQVVDTHRAKDGTEKLLVRLADHKHVECVLLRDGQRRTICVSSQVGCAMGCVFCASGLDGVDRNLTSGEIVEQALHLQALLPDAERITHVVMMGMGEPLANLDQVLTALDSLHDAAGLGIGARRITISTVGLPAAMDRLCRHPRKYHLAVSLHAATDALRNQLVPINVKIGLAKILAAADRYFEASGRRLTFEYVLLRGVNDSERHARELAQLLKGRPALLNVIPYNAVTSLPYQTPSTQAVDHFRQILETAGITVQFRQRKGDKINAACGQLRQTYQLASLPAG